ncbi:MAG: ribosome maturation factor RimM [Chloroflexota bacterium]
MGRDGIAAGDVDEWMVIGVIAGAFGIRGEMKIDLLTDFPERFDGLRTVYIGPQREKKPVRSTRRHRGRVLLALEGIDSPEAIPEVRGLQICVPRTEAVELPEGHFFLQDAIGVEVRLPDSTLVGIVSDVFQTGGNEVFVVKRGGESVLVPSVADAVLELDLNLRSMKIAPWVLEPPL